MLSGCYSPSADPRTLIHLTAMAGRLGLQVDPAELNELSETTPVLVELKPTGAHYMEDLHASGGLPAVLHDLLDLSVLTVTGETLGERLGDGPVWVDREVVRRLSAPSRPKGGLVWLSGSLAPAGALIKRSAADPALFETTGRAVVFTSLEDLAARIDDPDLEVEPADVLVLQNAGPLGAGMPEAGYLPIPAKLARRGVRDMVRISDAHEWYGVRDHRSPRDSGSRSRRTAGLVRTGDRVRLSVSETRLDLLVPPDELDVRRAALAPPRTGFSDPGLTGYRRLFRDHVLGADRGCDFDFCLPSAGPSAGPVAGP